MKKLFGNLTFQVLTAIGLGVLLGALFPAAGVATKPLSDAFLNLIKMVVTPIIFLTVVTGIGNVRDLRKVGRVGGKALLYFEVVTTLALLIGVAAANWLRPGAGVATTASAAGTAAAADYTQRAGQMDWAAFFTHLVPDSVVGAFARGDTLQVLLFSVLFGAALTRAGEAGRGVLASLERFSTVMFQLLAMVMRLAPLGAFAGMAFTLGKYGVATLVPLAKLMAVTYLTMGVFVFGVLNGIARWAGFSLWRYLVFIREEILLVLGTSSSESALPRLIEKMERFGCARSVAGLVIPTGYSFNLDGTTIYLAIATIFLAQAYHVELSWTQQLGLIGVLMLTSKGAAAVTGGGFLVLASTLTATRVIPTEGLALLLGVDRFMSEARAITNLIGNGVASIVVAKSEGAFVENGRNPGVSSGV